MACSRDRRRLLTLNHQSIPSRDWKQSRSPTISLEFGERIRLQQRFAIAINNEILTILQTPLHILGHIESNDLSVLDFPGRLLQQITIDKCVEID
jgi:hypothetical protein